MVVTSSYHNIPMDFISSQERIGIQTSLDEE
jgi:hypothetical protein